MTGLLSINNVSKSFAVRRNGLFAPRKTVAAVCNVSAEIAPGTTFGIVGESGSGKSTLARIALGLMTPDAGEVRFAGTPLAPVRSKAWRDQRRSMQMVYQNPLAALNPRRTIRDQLAEPFDIHRAPVEHRRPVKELAELVGLQAALLDRYPQELSGGQRQRVVIGRALAMRPQLLVCDEPVSALDVSIAAQVIALLKNLQRVEGLTYVFISHDLRVVWQIADTVAVMHQGRFVEIGTSDQVFLTPQHAYTRALIAAIPDARRKLRRIATRNSGEPRPADRLVGNDAVAPDQHDDDRTNPSPTSHTDKQYETACTPLPAKMMEER